MYEAQFGFSDLPFQISPDARFYVDATPHRAALDMLRAQGVGVAVVDAGAQTNAAA